MSGNQLNQYRRELAETLAGFLPQESESRIRHIVKCVTAGWSVTKRSDLHLTDDGRIVEAADPMAPSLPDDVTRYRVLWSLTTAPRPLTRDEEITRRERIAARDWRYSSERYRKDNPPPRGVPVHVLLDQRKWWLPSGSEAVRIKQIGAEYRASLADWLYRRSDELMLASLGGRKDMPEHVARGLSELDADQWLSRQPLFIRLCELIALDVRDRT